MQIKRHRVVKTPICLQDTDKIQLKDTNDKIVTFKQWDFGASEIHLKLVDDNKEPIVFEGEKIFATFSTKEGKFEDWKALDGVYSECKIDSSDICIPMPKELLENSGDVDMELSIYSSDLESYLTTTQVMSFKIEASLSNTPPAYNPTVMAISGLCTTGEVLCGEGVEVAPEEIVVETSLSQSFIERFGGSDGV